MGCGITGNKEEEKHKRYPNTTSVGQKGITKKDSTGGQKYTGLSYGIQRNSFTYPVKMTETKKQNSFFNSQNYNTTPQTSQAPISVSSPIPVCNICSDFYDSIKKRPMITCPISKCVMCEVCLKEKILQKKQIYKCPLCYQQIFQNDVKVDELLYKKAEKATSQYRHIRQQFKHLFWFCFQYNIEKLKLVFKKENYKQIVNEATSGQWHQKKIVKIEAMQHFSSLKNLSYQENNITKIEGLQNLNNLEKINLSHNQIRKIQGIKHLKNLNEVVLSGNKISSMKGLEDLPILNCLILSFNQIQEIKIFDNLVYLESLCLFSNPLKRQSMAEIIQKPWSKLKILQISFDAYSQEKDQNDAYNLFQHHSAKKPWPSLLSIMFKKQVVSSYKKKEIQDYVKKLGNKVSLEWR